MSLNEKQSAIADYKNCTLMAVKDINKFIAEINRQIAGIKIKLESLERISEEITGRVDVLDIPGRYKSIVESLNQINQLNKEHLSYRLEMLELYRQNYREAISAE